MNKQDYEEWLDTIIENQAPYVLIIFVGQNITFRHDLLVLFHTFIELVHFTSLPSKIVKVEPMIAINLSK